MEMVIGILSVLLILFGRRIVVWFADWVESLWNKKPPKHSDENEYEERMQARGAGLREYQLKRQAQKEEADSPPNELAGQPVPSENTEEVKVENIIDKDMENDMESMKGTRNLFLETLTKIGCSYEIEPEDERISFQWQGGLFTADVTNESPFVVVWYFHWEQYELYDVDAFSRMRKVINDANIHYNMNVVYSVDEEGSTFSLHTKKHFLFIPQIPHITDYLNVTLGQFFVVRRYVESELDKQKNAEERAGLR